MKNNHTDLTHICRKKGKEKKKKRELDCGFNGLKG